MKYVYLTNGVVTDMVQVNPMSVLQRGYAERFVQAPDDVDIGWTLVDGQYHPPETALPAVPQSVSMRQARLALHAAGMLASVEAAIARLPEPDKTAAQITWEFAATVDRGFGMVPALASAMGMTDTQIDDLFFSASQL